MELNRRRFVSGALAATLGVAGASGTVAAADVTFSHDGEVLALPTSSSATVAGEASYGEGVRLTIRLRSTGSSPFLKQTTARVAGDGSFAATFDMSDIEPGTECTATALWNGIEQAETTVRVTAVDPALSLDVEGETLTLAPADDQSVTGNSALAEGEAVTLRVESNRGATFREEATATVDPDGSFAAAFDLSDVEAGTLFLVEALYREERETFAIGEVVTDD